MEHLNRSAVRHHCGRGSSYSLERQDACSFALIDGIPVWSRLERQSVATDGVDAYLRPVLQQLSVVQNDRVGCSSLSGLRAADNAAAGPYKIR